MERHPTPLHTNARVVDLESCSKSTTRFFMLTQHRSPEEQLTQSTTTIQPPP
ncbi:hypothetical protein RISK_004655 [Rhodopirellula islandica]|uniref:Uncharacterized protein n=1 Tax=Rhodopirellula islandica TaxID=595434 RepID=A0A0J1B9X3_RHOIS|nr:hypothetical protein RISK_004655 [Rhodopirellula islandica]